MTVQIANNATSRLASSISSTDTTFSVQPGDGSKFPALTAGNWFPISLIKADGQLEICRCTARVGDVLTVLRGQENTSAKAFAAGDRAELRLTAAAVDAVRSEATQAALAYHGQCRFVYVSPTECRLMPYNGNGLIINGKQYRIPAAGVPLANTGLAVSASYYVYAKDDGAGGVELEALQFAAAPHSKHTDGVEIKTGDPTRTLVGMAVMTAASQFLVNDTNYGIASWFNRKQIRVYESFATGTASGTLVNLNNGWGCCAWASETVLELVVSGSTASTVNAYSVLSPRLNGAFMISDRATLLFAGADSMICYVWKATPVVDGRYVINQMGRSSSGSVVNWNVNQIGEAWL